MSPSQKKRLGIVALIIAGVTLAAFFAVMAMQSSLEYFKRPSEIHAEGFDLKQTYKLAGLVRKGSLSRLDDGITQRFSVTDCVEDVTVQYTGILPDLFREGQAIISVGKFDSEQVLIASQVLAKHDENYVPNEAAEALMLQQANRCDEADGPVDY
jgi:cytochrome c-type biogenesis protein CcmE